MNESAHAQSLLDFVRENNSSDSLASNVSYHVNDTFVDTSTTAVLETVTNPNLLLPGFMMGLVAVFSCLLCYILLPMFLQWLRRKIPASKNQINRRYETIEGWLITKRVKAHCVECDEMQRLFVAKNGSPSIKLVTSHDTAETILHEQEQHSCPICMEPFEHDDIVSWSPSAECEHVFHHSCIKTWLLHHVCCSYCRICVLSVDKRNVDIPPSSTSSWLPSSVLPKKSTKRVRTWKTEQLNELAIQRHQRLQSTYYCLREGLVSLDQSPTVNSSDIETTNSTTADMSTITTTDLPLTTSRSFFMSDIPVLPNDMMALRTHPKSIRSTSDVVVTITSPTSRNDATDTTVSYNTAGEHDEEDLRAADEIINIETTVKELPVVTNDVTNQDDSV